MSVIAQIHAARDAVHLPKTYENAKTALAQCASLDECSEWADKAAALASYAKQAEDEELEKMAVRIRGRAVRRMGEILKQIEPQRGANQNIQADDHHKVLTRTDAARDAGISPYQAKTAIRVANVENFDELIESDSPPTTTKLAEMGTVRRVLDLKGRDPQAFNRCLHFVAAFEGFLDELGRFDHSQIIAELSPTEAAELRGYITRIDAALDHIITRI